jgi:hypothetical protein
MGIKKALKYHINGERDIIYACAAGMLLHRNGKLTIVK